MTLILKIIKFLITELYEISDKPIEVNNCLTPTRKTRISEKMFARSSEIFLIN